MPSEDEDRWDSEDPAERRAAEIEYVQTLNKHRRGNEARRAFAQDLAPAEFGPMLDFGWGLEDHHGTGYETGKEYSEDLEQYYDRLPEEFNWGDRSLVQLGDPAQASVTGDANAIAAQQAALANMLRYAEGWSDEDSAALLKSQDQQDAFARGALGALQQQREERGQVDPNIAAAMGAVVGQDEAQRESDMALSSQQAVDARALKAMSQAERLRASMEKQRVSEELNRANAIELFNRMNLDYRRQASQRDADRYYNQQRALANEAASQWNTAMGIYANRAQEAARHLRGEEFDDNARNWAIAGAIGGPWLGSSAWGSGQHPSGGLGSTSSSNVGGGYGGDGYGKPEKKGGSDDGWGSDYGYGGQAAAYSETTGTGGGYYTSKDGSRYYDED